MVSGPRFGPVGGVADLRLGARPLVGKEMEGKDKGNRKEKQTCKERKGGGRGEEGKKGKEGEEREGR